MNQTIYRRKGVNCTSQILICKIFGKQKQYLTYSMS
uniref:Uncharacterized protein n=1 Tax=Arundo donax TaxID=35708 RepID=A0A0A9CFN2_ARUDO